MFPKITLAALCLTVLSAAPAAAASRNHHFNPGPVISGAADGSKGLEGLAASDPIKTGLCSSPLTHALRAVLCGLQPTLRTSHFHMPAIADLAGACGVNPLADRRDHVRQVPIRCSPSLDFMGDAIAPPADGRHAGLDLSERLRFAVGSSRAVVL